jgi:hypothetical protein
MIVSRESSPFDSGASPRGFWQSKIPSSSPFNENAYDRPDSPSVSRRRTSIENLKKASRVKNSSMFAREQMGEYDPGSPVVIERPLAAGRPLSLQSNPAPFTAPRAIDAVVKKDVTGRGHRRGESQTQIPLMQPTPTNPNMQPQPDQSPSQIPSRNQPSPSKSSMSKNNNTLPRNFDPSSAELSDEDDSKFYPPQALRRQAKSVTFDAAPPQVNEYEMATPDPSSVASGSREGSYDVYDEDDMYDIDREMDPHDEDSFDESLEDTAKTPVVLPEDWRGMSPDTADTTLAARLEDVFNGQQQEDGRSTPSKEWNKFRTASIGSDGDSRPLPPVPQFTENDSRRNSGSILERVHNAHRSLPAPPQAASVSKSDILGMKDKTMTLEERLRLMGLGERSGEKSSPDQAAREKARLQRHGLGIHVHEDEPSKTDLPANFTFPRISRESIMRKVKSRSMDFEKEVEVECASSPPRDYDIDNLDPDVPIPSREGSSDHVHIKQEHEEDTSLYSFAHMIHGTASPQAEERSGSVVRHSFTESNHDDSMSVYSDANEDAKDAGSDSGPPTPRPEAAMPKNEQTDHSILPDFSTLDNSEFHTSVESYLSAGSSDLRKPGSAPQKKLEEAQAAAQEYVVRDVSPLDDDADRPESPDSVVYQPLKSNTATEGRLSPIIPEPLATIKAPGTQLKTRPSAVPADVETMAATRRQVSGSFPPPVPEKSPKRLSFTATVDNTNESEVIERAVAAHKKRRESFKPKLEFPGELGEDLSLDLDKEFNRVIESSKVDYPLSYLSPIRESINSCTYDFRYPVQEPAEEVPDSQISSLYQSKSLSALHANTSPKKGYLMRQNTKVIVAKRTFSNETTDSNERPASADDVLGKPSQPSPRKPSHDRSKSWTTEPWNGKTRRKSLRSVDKKAPSGPAPPLPGQPSALDLVPEDQSLAFEEAEEGVERGRLFVKVVGVKDLDLPLPQSMYWLFHDSGPSLIPSR